MSLSEHRADQEPTASQLPIDTFDAIASHLERPSDLLSLALTCRGLAQIVLSRHIQYRDVALVQLDAKDEMIWNTLLAHPDRTANIRRLEVRLRGCCPGLDGRTFIPSFSQIIALMRRLSYLKVSEPPDSSDIIVHSWELCWKVLQSHNSLATLEISFGQMMLSSKELGFVQLRNLKNIYLEYLGHSRNGYVLHKIQEVFTSLLMRNQSLALITLQFPHITLNAKPLLRDGNFPCLRGLRCCFRITRESVAYVGGFMARHPTLEALHWDVTSRNGVADSVSDTLPVLREISGESEHVSAFLKHRSEPPRPLYSMANITVDASFWENIRPTLNTEDILKLDVEQFGCIGDIYRFAREFPNLVWLRVDLSDVIWDDTSQSLRNMKNAEWGDVLDHFPRLQVIRGIDFLEDPDFPNENTERIILLSNLLPNLRFLDHWTSSRLVVRIVREDGSDNIRWEVVDAYHADSVALK